MKRLPTSLLLATSIIFSTTHGLIKVKVNQDMCNAASETTTARANGILDQITQHTSPSGEQTMEASWTWSSTMESNTGINDGDVFYLGPGGTDLDSNKMTVMAAAYLGDWAQKGHGFVLTSHGHISLGDESVQTAMDQFSPAQSSGSSDYCKPNGATAIQMTVNTSLANHYLLRNVPNQWKMYAHCYVPNVPPSEDAISVASFSKGGGSCHNTITNDPINLTAQSSKQGIMFRERAHYDKDSGEYLGTSRVVWLCAPYCGYDLYQPFNLRSGADEQIFANALEWASGLCREVNDCNAHGSCRGKNNCACDPGYAGTACDEFHCEGGCGRGKCIGGNMCECEGNFGGDNCEKCQDGWHGAECTVPENIQDGYFKNHAKWWNTTASTSTDITFGDNKATFKGDSQALSQRVYFPIPMYTYNRDPYIVFDTSIPEGTTLEVYIDDKLVWSSETASMSGNSAYININEYSETGESEGHVVKFVTKGASSSKPVTISNVGSGYGDCADDCGYGNCVYRLECVCWEHYEGKNCSQAICGDGYIVFQKEECDDNNTNDGDGCSSKCVKEVGFNCDNVGYLSVCNPICGDGMIVNGEECDDNNTKDGDGCSSKCKVELGCNCTGVPSKCDWECGNNYISGSEECDGKPRPDGCSDKCKIVDGYDCKLSDYSEETTMNGPSICKQEKCGDGSKTRSEECDDGNNNNNDGCTSDCKIEAGWECTVSEIWAISECREVCGNSKRSASEACDDGNTIDGDGCSSSCQIEDGWHCTGELGGLSECKESCGDGVRTKSEECDDGNTDDNDGCNSSCMKEVGWDCHEGVVDGHPKKSVCQLEVCGDGIRTRSEECDIKDNLTDDGTSGCTTECKITHGWECGPNDLWDESVCYEVCGNKVKTISETCDDGNTEDGDGCTHNCSIVETGYACTLTATNKSVCRLLCSDGVRSENEQCDDGNVYGGDGCNHKCEIEKGWNCTTELNKLSVCVTIKGDGYAVPNYEECDDGNTEDGDGCSSDSKIEHGWYCTMDLQRKSTCYSVCGDGKIASNEKCDDGNTDDGDGCSKDCKIEKDWECIDEPNECTPTGCGNGHLNTDEECDDGNRVSGDGCDEKCKIEAGWDCIGKYNNNSRLAFGKKSTCIAMVCGDGHLSYDEECDDGNTKSRDGCSSECKVETSIHCNTEWDKKSKCFPIIECGNGIVSSSSGEECDDNNTEDGDGCSSDCKVEPGWFCQIGPNNKAVTYFYPSVCRQMTCGDGIQEGGEECDDGNKVDGDGCSANCTLELGYTCVGSVCESYCGNGRIGGDEECDDGNLGDYDGCSSDCKVEEGWNCTTDPETGTSVCESFCGDGIIAANEDCDDGNGYGGDGCSYECKIEDGFRCSGTPSKCYLRLKANSTSAWVVANNSCAGLMQGEIRASMYVETYNEDSEMNEYIAEYKLEGPGYEFPDYTTTGHWQNLGSGNYTVHFYVDRYEEEEMSVSLTIFEPATLSAYLLRMPDGTLGVKTPTNCDTKDGAVYVRATGGTPPYTYYMGSKTSTTGEFVNLGYKEFAYTQIMDANNCSYMLYDTRKDIECSYPKLDKFLRDVWDRGGPDGVIILGVALAVIIFLIICYWVWDWKAFKKDNNEEKKFRVEMTKIKEGGEGAN